MILVGGATGTIGRVVARRLAAEHPVRLLTRDPGRITVTAPGTEVVRGDYADESSLRRALHGVRAAFLVTVPSAEGDDARFLAAAGAAGVERVVKLSAAAVEDPAARDGITRRQRENERILRSSGCEWTILRPRSFMSNTLSWRTSIQEAGIVRALYGTSANACVDPRDVAETAVHALTGPGHAHRTYTLTGPTAITAVEQTATLARVLELPLRCEELDFDAARDALSRRYPAPIVQALLDSAARQRDGAKARVCDTVREITGRAPRSYEEWAADHRSAFTRSASADLRPAR
ncbi:NAD(P)H-binding protein [Streptomyces sp. NPDC056084]|uniref:NAD(P)H-binding protein n=1 Tax=unclassified Streptomyces TaxID=2593676 RepID=UPI0035DEACD3